MSRHHPLPHFRIDPIWPPNHGGVSLELDNTNGSKPVKAVVTAYPTRAHSGAPTPGTALAASQPVCADIGAKSSESIIWETTSGSPTCCCVTVDIYDNTDSNNPVYMVSYGPLGLSSKNPNPGEALKTITGVSIAMIDPTWGSSVTLNFSDTTSRVATQASSNFAGSGPFVIASWRSGSVTGNPLVMQLGQFAPNAQDAHVCQGVLGSVDASHEQWTLLPFTPVPAGAPALYNLFSSVELEGSQALVAWWDPDQSSVASFCPNPPTKGYFLLIQFSDGGHAGQTPAFQLVCWQLGTCVTLVNASQLTYQRPDTDAPAVCQYWSFLAPSS